MSKLRILQQKRAEGDYQSAGRFISRIPIPVGLIMGIGLLLDGTPVGTITDNVDDSPWTLVSELRITFPTKRGEVVVTTTGRDLYLAMRYVNGYRNEDTIAASTADFFSSLYYHLGGGIHSDDLAARGEIVIEGTWAAATEYGAGATGITNGFLTPTLYIDPSMGPSSARRTLLLNTTPLLVEAASLVPSERINVPSMAETLAGCLFRQEDNSAQADRVDGLVTRVKLMHSQVGTLVDQTFKELRQAGLRVAGIDPTQAVEATPRGLDGTALYIADPALSGSGYALGRANLSVGHDSAEAVPKGTTDVTPAAGDRLHCTVLALARLGGG